MDVGINYRDLLVSGRLPALARALGVSEEAALGRFVVSCFETQHRELVTVSADEYAEAVGLRIDSPNAMLAALVTAKLASPTPGEHGRWTLHGNDKHVAKLKTFRERASKGGFGKNKQQPASSSFKQLQAASSAQQVSASKHHRATKQQASKPKAAGTVPASCQQPADSLPWILGTGIGDHDLQISDPDPEVIYNSEDLPDLARQQKTPRGAGGLQRAIAKPEPEHTPTHQVRLRYEALWSQKFGRPYVGWSAKHARHAANVSKSAAALEETFALLEIFFAWNDPRVASAYSFCDGAFSFMLQRDALRARLAKPDHERMVGIIGAARNQSNNQDAEKMQRERALDQFVDRFAREVTESERAASVSIGQQNPVKHPVKQFLSASGGAS